MKNKRQVIPFRRKREGKTNYKKRIAYLTSGKPRLVIRRSLQNITVQVIAYEQQGDRVLVNAHSQQLRKLGWKLSGSNTSAAYLVGFLAGTKAKQAKINSAILDLGLYQPIKGSKIYAALKGAVDAGLQVPHDQSVLPKQERIEGKHIQEHKKIDVQKAFTETINKIKGTR
jgi:large subunit ribosomal protein L18